MAHWDSPPAGEKLRSTWFFAPERVALRTAQWGGRAFHARVDEALATFLADARSLYRLDRRDGADGALAAYTDAVEGRADPGAGVIVAA